MAGVIVLVFGWDELDVLQTVLPAGLERIADGREEGGLADVRGPVSSAEKKTDSIADESLLWWTSA